MNRDIKQRTKDVIFVIFLTIIFISLQITIIYMGRIQITVFNGIFSALQYGTCLLMLIAGRKYGYRTAIILMTLSLCLLIMSFSRTHQMSMMPGLINGIFYIITLIVLARYYYIREMESVTDLLTGALNRRGLYKELIDRIESDKKFSVICISLDNLKAVNDSYGHAYGDEVVRKIHKRIQIKMGKDCKIAKLGGSEFVVVLSNRYDAVEMANTLLDVIREKTVLVVDDIRVDCYMTCYAGIASYPNDAKDYESLIKYADIAMTDAISLKSKSAFSFDLTMAEMMSNNIEMEKLVKESLTNGYFYLMYQPQFDIKTKKIRGFEALLRMKTREGRMISPVQFIPAAEKSELILKIDDYVINRVMTEFKDIVKINKDIVVSINVSAKNIGDEGFIDKIRKALFQTEFPPENLEIEITEYCMLNSMDVTTSNINSLKQLGIQVALDDFGTGYTSLNYVTKLPINLLKIDKSLVDDISNDEKSREFIKMVIALGHLMGCEVISEGVEDENQLKYLFDNECDYVQGYVWGKPLEYDIAKDMAVGKI